MATESPAAAVTPPPAAPRSRGWLGDRIGAFVLGLVPGALVLYLGFNGGGFFPGTVGFACLIVIQLLIVRVLLANHPFEGFGRSVAFIGFPLAGFVTWILLSALWSDSHDRVLIEFDRGLLYLTVFLLFALTARTAERIPWIVRGLCAGIVIVGSFGLVSRLRPDVIPTISRLSENRLAYPLTYWNALAILCAVGILLLLGLSSRNSEPRLSRALAAAGVPILALTMYFTFSRGPLLALVIGLVVFLLTARSAGVIGTVLAVVPTAVFAVYDGYQQAAISSTHTHTHAALSQGRHLLPVIIVCAVIAFALRLVAAFVLDRRLAAIEISPAQRRYGRFAAAGTALFAVILALALGAPGWISHEYHGFVHGSPTKQQGDLRFRFTDPSANGRIEHWRVAAEDFTANPFHGSGAGTYEYAWNKRRNDPTAVVDAHGLYIEVLAEYGVVGLVLLATALIGIVVVLASRVRSGRNRILYAGALAATVAWVVHAGVDWDWEMPAVTAWLFALGGTAAAQPFRTRVTTPAAQRSRVPIAIALVVCAITPAVLLGSQSTLQASADAFRHGNCRSASAKAADSIDQLALRPQPYRIIGYCDIQKGRGAAAVAAMKKAVSKGPRDWESHYGLALALASDGRDPRPQIQRARRLNPLAPIVKDAVSAFRSDSASAWRRAAPAQLQTATASGLLTLH